MSDTPNAEDGGEELDLGEIEEDADEGQEGDAADEGDGGHADGDEGQEEGQEGDGDVAAAPQRTGRKTQAQRWRERAERAEREAAEARGFRAAAEQFQSRAQQQADPAAQQRAAEERANRLAMMSPVEAAEYIANERTQQFQQMLLMQQLQTEDRLDKRDYDQQARTDRHRAQYRERVERELQAERQAGNLRATRDGIFFRLFGQDAAERAARAAPGQRRAAARRVAGAQARPTGARGDGASGGRRPAPGTPEHDDMLVSEFFRSGGTL
jgi:hypothetical protein